MIRTSARNERALFRVGPAAATPGGIAGRATGNPVSHPAVLLERQRRSRPSPPAEAGIVLQLWRYRPDVLSDGVIDPFSLALSLRGESDERVQMAIDEMLEELQW